MVVESNPAPNFLTLTTEQWNLPSWDEAKNNPSKIDLSHHDNPCSMMPDGFTTYVE
jgi:hypothetical protein